MSPFSYTTQRLNPDFKYPAYAICWNSVYAVHCSLYTGYVYIGLTPLSCLNQVVKLQLDVTTGYEPRIVRVECSLLLVVMMTASLIAVTGESSYVVRV
jgi:hypothetical protein